MNHCIACNPNYAPTGSKISLQWQELLFEGQGLGGTSAQKPAFERAKALLYTDYCIDFERLNFQKTFVNLILKKYFRKSSYSPSYVAIEIRKNIFENDWKFLKINPSKISRYTV